MDRRQNLWQDGEEEETMTYLDWKPGISLNAEPGVFEQRSLGGINTNKSVFERTAVFRTGDREDKIR